MNNNGWLGAWFLGFALSIGCNSGTNGGGSLPQGTGGYWTGPQVKSHKLDLLFVVDNSLAMADKQAFLMPAAGRLLDRLLAPNCVDADGRPTGSVVDSNGDCPTGQPEARPVDDLHVGVVSSSLGCRGRPCMGGAAPTNPFEDDRGELVGSLRHSGLAADGTDINYSTYADLGFLAWDAKGTANDPPGLSDRAALSQALRQMIAAAGEQGCGLESPQEAWYRFLVDPEPPSAVVLNPTTNETQAITNPPDDAVLAQRAAFLRPDSAVAIVLISDENDCSIIDYGQGWLVAGNDQPMARPTSQCATNPNDPCCRSCQESGSQYANCPPAASDLNCTADDGSGPGYLTTRDNCPCLRCWETKRRFGLDLLFPIQRYVDGLSKTVILNRASQPVTNPLFAGGRSPSLVTLVGIVGVPWQDVATADTLDPASANLTLLTFDQMVATQPNRWDVMLGDPAAGPPIPPTDAFMVESIDARSGTNPITGQSTVDASSLNPLATINGHEFSVNPNLRDDLQYACIFQLPADRVRDCTEAAFTSTDPATRRGCDCKAGGTTDPVAARNRPLCQPPTEGAASTTQYFAKAYPGTRHLELLKRLGPRGLVGSVCPKVGSDASASSASGYGYNAAMEATVARLRSMLE